MTTGSFLSRRRVRFVEHERCVDCWSGWSISVHKLARSRLRRPAVCWARASPARRCMCTCETGRITSRIHCRCEPGFAIVPQRCARIFPRCSGCSRSSCSASRTLLGAQDEQGSSHHRHRQRRAHAGRLVQRRAGQPAGARARQGRHQGRARAGARRAGRSVRGHPGPDPGGRRRPEPGAAGLDQRRHPGRCAGLGHEPAVRLGPARGRARRPADRSSAPPRSWSPAARRA